MRGCMIVVRRSLMNLATRYLEFVFLAQTPKFMFFCHSSDSVEMSTVTSFAESGSSRTLE